MNKLATISASILLATAGLTAFAVDAADRSGWGQWANDPYALEPSINGWVSASGEYPTQALEDAALAAQGSAGTDQAGWGEWANDPHALEPAINGGVSATGLYPTQALEDAATAGGVRGDLAVAD